MEDTCTHQWTHKDDRGKKRPGPRLCKICGTEETLAPNTQALELHRENVSGSFGPDMKALTDMQQRFVIALCDTDEAEGGDEEGLVIIQKSNVEAARLAGYSQDGSPGGQRVAAYRLAHDPRVQAAIVEWSRASLATFLPTATARLKHTAARGSGRDSNQAIGMIMDRVGMEKKQNIEVVHKTEPTREEKILGVIQMAKIMGVDPRQFVGTIIDVTPEEIP